MIDTPLIDIRPDHWQIVKSILQKHVPQHEVWAFGSRAKWKAKEYSDLDLAVITDKPLSLELNARLSDDFSESDLPWKVDIVDWATTREAFRKIIEKEKVVVQEGVGMGNEWKETPYGRFAGDFYVDQLANLCNPKAGIQTGPFGSQLHQEDYVQIGTPIITVEHLGENRILHANTPKVSDADVNRLARYQLNKGDIVFSRVGSVDRRALVRKEEEGWLFSGRCLRVRPDSTKIDSQYLSFFFGLPAFKEHIRSIAVGATMPSLNTSLLSEVTIPHPPNIEEQRAIAHILGTLDDKIEVNRRMNETLESMARALFKAWFVDFEPVRAKLEGRWQRGQSLPGLPAHLYDLFPDWLVESELGEIPEGWEIRSLGQQLTILGGGTPKTSNSEYWDGEIPWFSVVDTPRTGDVFVVETEKTITQVGLEGSSARLIPKGTTIISARGTVGNLAIAGRDMTFNQSCYGLQGAEGAGDYFVYLIALQMVDQLKAMAHGSVFSTITRQTFEAVQRPAPPPDTLQAFEKSAAPWFDTILSNVEQSRALAQLRDTLLPKLISGELRIKNADKFMEQIEQTIHPHGNLS